MLVVTSTMTAQDDVSTRQLLTQAEYDYKIGRLDQALQLLTTNEAEFKGNLLQNAYRLIALCYLGQDQPEQATAYAQKLLGVNPFYTSVQDPIRFEEIIMQLKSRKTATVTTASSQIEHITESPVPITIITREMIDMLGNNKDLNSILAAYVPGITEVSTSTMNNVAMHGIYTSSQEKILVMENGHRLNARSTNNGRLDYAVSTEKIDHIEVLRGPASSLYGNVALTGVVNIITRKGSTISGIKGKYGLGTYGTHRVDLLGGTSFLGADIMAWASYYGASGKKVDIVQGDRYSYSNHNGYAYIGRYGGKPSYDFGTKLQAGDFSMMLNQRYGKLVPQYSLYGEVYDYDKYRKLDGVTPGLSINETHFDLGYTKQLGALGIDASLYFDMYSFYDYTSVSDSIVNVTFNYDGTLVTNEDGTPVTKLYHGLSQEGAWEENTIGGVVKTTLAYRIGKMHGDLLFGGQYEHFTMNDTYSLIGEEYDMISLVLPASKNYIKTGHENILSFFLQDKHFITPSLIFNAGLRFDYKFRVNNQHVTALSPRLALVYRPDESFSMKISYARAFVDAPYFYRQNTSNSYRGSENLMPEYINALQFDVIGILDNLNLEYDVNVFYNQLTDIISNTQSTQVSSVKYRNSGKLKIMGIEGELNYSLPYLKGRLSMTYQHPLSAEDYYFSDHHIFSVPSVEGSLCVSWRLLKTGTHNLWLKSLVRATGKTLEKGMMPENKNELAYMDGKVLFDLGLSHHFNKMVQLTLDVENVFNASNYLGGTTYFPYQRLGRTGMATLSFQL